ncbi:Rqc2 family fibronectin-binding protein [Acetivibrio clariflavus]|uniref:Rqc2 homolog RqcH n=1 Tax=Acetivibrio clariflavus (strain DSM 19732 / NBRC 101661 / EBR45) TaxID=720554 RepID=G8M0P9_ACECE|nr:NFACT RNA binding domain-containing protein [Acetivibrio clariflavus]AEV69130.1 putative RNA-binding protein, snRNP like protein [Acetivibrio clariflavus DSM 19732]
MPFDGVVAKNVAMELYDILVGGRIDKIYQPEQDEILIHIRAKGQNYKLLLSANASYPRIHLTSLSKENPMNPPVFCMLLRKHLQGGRIVNIEFYDFERIISVHVEALNEMGDTTYKKLLIEIMGKHSNIILLNDNDIIIDSIKHIDSDISRVREVMPARLYTFPPGQDKENPEKINLDEFMKKTKSQSGIRISKYLLNSIKGFSPLLCDEVCYRAQVDAKTPIDKLTDEELEKIKNSLSEIILKISSSNFTPCIAWSDQTKRKPLDFHSLEITQYPILEYNSSICHILDLFYTSKDNAERLVQKKSALNKILNNYLDRCNKKIAIHQDTLRQVADRDKFKLYGELITANIYCIPKNAKKVSLLNYYSENNEYIDIPLDENLLPQDNAQMYFKKFAKAKNAFNYASAQLEDAYKELEYIESVIQNLDSATSTQEIEEIRQELVNVGYLSESRSSKNKKNVRPLEPYRYKSSDGYDILVGRNNVQNDILTLKTASSNDLWLHTKNIPGSHVIVKKQAGDIPDTTLIEAALIAAYHSKGKMSSHVEVDYTQVKNVKKPKGAKPGMVTYVNYKTIVVTPDENKIRNLEYKYKKVDKE